MATSGITNHLRSIQLPEAQKTLLKQIEQENFFPIAFEKSRITDRKRSHFQSRGHFEILIVSSFNNYDAVIGPIAGLPTAIVQHTEIQSLASGPENGLSLLENRLVILTSNTVNRIGLESFSQLADRTPKTLYAIHDIDSHHWYQLGILLAGVADIYIPGHPDSFLIATRINPHVVGGIPIGSTQWSREFLSQKFTELVSIQRSDIPFGPHSFYPDFQYRNQLLTTFAAHSPEIRLQVSTDTNAFLQKSADERWREWASHKLHLVAPVSNDIPNRFFDALITGGLPLVPIGLRFHLLALGIPEEHFLPYSPSDIANPPTFFKKALRHFDNAGSEGCLRRALFALEKFHAESILESIAAASAALYLSSSLHPPLPQTANIQSTAVTVKNG